MDENQFERFLEEFRDLKDDYHESIARSGLMKISQQAQQQQDPRSPGGIRVVGRGEAASSDDSIDRGFLGSIIEDLKSNVYRVRLEHAMQDVVLPLYQRLEILQLENQIFNNKLHHESTMYFKAMLEAIRNANEQVRESFIGAVTLQYQMFMRHPIWNTMKGINTALVQPITKTAMGLIFGFNKEMNTQEKILEAIKQQTEFLRTGEIGPSRGFFGRLIQGGIVGALGRTAGSALGIGRGAAQRREDARARGEEVAGGIQGFLTDFFSNKRDLTIRGRNGRGNITDSSEDSRDPVERIRDLFADALSVRNSDSTGETIFGQYELKESVTEPLTQSLGGPLQALSHDSARTVDITTEILRAMEKQKEYVAAVHNGLDSHFSSASFQRLQEEKSEEERVGREEEMVTAVSQIARHSRVTAREAVRARRMRFLSMIAGIAGSIGNMASNLAGSLVGALKGAAGMAVGGAIAGGLGAGLTRLLVPVTIAGGASYLGNIIGEQIEQLTGLSEWKENRRQQDIEDYGMDVSQMSLRDLLSLSDEEKAQINRGNEDRRRQSPIDRFFHGRFDPNPEDFPEAPSTTNRQPGELVLPPGQEELPRAIRENTETNRDLGSSLSSSISESFNSLRDRMSEMFDRQRQNAVEAVEGNFPGVSREARDNHRENQERAAAQQAVQEEELGYLRDLANSMKEMLNIQKRSSDRDIPPDSAGFLNQFSGFLSTR